MTRIVYIGNQLSGSGKSLTTIDTLSPLLKNLGYEVVTASSKQNKLLRLLEMVYTVYKNSSKTNYVLIDTYSTLNFWYAVIVARVCRTMNLKYIPILHGGNLPQRLKSHPKTTLKFLNKAYKVVSPSDYLKDAFAKAITQKIVHIPNNIELQNYPFLHRQAAKPKLLWVRSFAHIYQPKMAVQVLHKLQSVYPNAELCMVGPDKDGSLEECKEMADSLGLSINFTGLLSKNDWISLSKQYDVFINTTNFDNLPVSLLEAMALGLPIVSTNVGGIPYIIKSGKNGLLCETQDVNGMVSHIKALVDQPELASKLSKNARSYVQFYDWDQVQLLWKELLT